MLWHWPLIDMRHEYDKIFLHQTQDKNKGVMLQFFARNFSFLCIRHKVMNTVDHHSTDTSRSHLIVGSQRESTIIQF